MIEQGDFSYEELSELATFYLEFQDFHEDQEGIEWSQKMLIMEGLAFITKAVAKKSEENLRYLILIYQGIVMFFSLFKTTLFSFINLSLIHNWKWNTLPT